MTSSRLRSAAFLGAITVLFAFSVPATGQSILGNLSGKPYISVSGAYGWAENSELENPIVADLEVNLGSNIGLISAIGWSFDNGIRIEAEYSALDIDIDGGSLAGVDFSASGQVDTMSTMGNILYEFGIYDRIRPYIGGGAGITWIDATLTSVAGMSVSGISPGDKVFSYQGIAGVAYEITPIVAVTADYRYFGTDEAELEGVDMNFTAHKISFGVRLTMPR